MTDVGKGADPVRPYPGRHSGPAKSPPPPTMNHNFATLSESKVGSISHEALRALMLKAPDGFNRLQANFDQLNTGARKAGKVLYGYGEWEWVPMGVSPQDAEFLAQRRFSIEEVCRFFGVPPQMVGDSSRQTYANFEQAGLNFLSLGLLPWLVRLEQS